MFVDFPPIYSLHDGVDYGIELISAAAVYWGGTYLIDYIVVNFLEHTGLVRGTAAQLFRLCRSYTLIALPPFLMVSVCVSRWIR